MGGAATVRAHSVSTAHVGLKPYLSFYNRKAIRGAMLTRQRRPYEISDTVLLLCAHPALPPHAGNAWHTGQKDPAKLRTRTPHHRTPFLYYQCGTCGRHGGSLPCNAPPGRRDGSRLRYKLCTPETVGSTCAPTNMSMAGVAPAHPLEFKTLAASPHSPY